MKPCRSARQLRDLRRLKDWIRVNGSIGRVLVCATNNSCLLEILSTRAETSAAAWTPAPDPSSGAHPLALPATAARRSQSGLQTPSASSLTTDSYCSSYYRQRSPLSCHECGALQVRNISTRPIERSLRQRLQGPAISDPRRSSYRLLLSYFFESWI